MEKKTQKRTRAVLVGHYSFVNGRVAPPHIRIEEIPVEPRGNRVNQTPYGGCP